MPKSPKKKPTPEQTAPSIDSALVFHSQAEKVVYEHLKAQLPKGSLILHSLQISHVPEEWGLVEREIDFVIFHPSMGLMVIEVKGGKIGFNAEDARFTSRNRNGRIHRIKDPFKQVHSVKTILLKMMRQAKVQSPVSSVVIAPDTDMTELKLPPFCNPKIIIGSADLEKLGARLNAIFAISHPEKFRQVRSSTSEIEAFLCGSSFSTKSYLGDFIGTEEARVLDIEQLYHSFLEPLIAQKRVAIEGDAGTGKSFLALTLAKKMQEERPEGAPEQKVLLLTSNRELAKSWSKEFAGTPNVKVSTYLGLAEHYGIRPMHKPDHFEGSKEDWLQVEAPARWQQALETEAAPYNVLICDEAQDVQPFWWEPICTLIRSDDSLFLFFDRKQGIFGSGGAQKSFHPEKILPVPAPYFPLIHNYRSTDQIVKYAQKLYPSKDNFLSHSRRQGMLPERLLYQDSEQAVAALSQRINHLVKEENVDPKDIQILSALRLDHPNSILRGKKMPHGVKASTVAAFKGLEAKIAILVNFSEHKMPFANPLMRNLLYVANTRAKHHLISVFREGCDKSEVSQKAIRSIEPAVSLVVSSDNAKSQSGTLVQVHSQQPLAVVMIEGKNVLTLLSSEQRSKLSGNIGKKVNIHVDMLEGLRFARLDAEKSS